MEITVALITELRNITNAGMMDCKKALIACNGDKEAAIKQLREKGLAIQVKRADKESNQGLIMAETVGSAIGMAEVNCETDFVAKTEKIVAFTKLVTETVAKGDLDAAKTLNNELVALISATGENLKIRRVARFEAQGTGKVESYIHLGGKVGVLVELGCTKAETVSNPAFEALLHDLCLQVAAASPRYLVPAEVPAELVEGEKDIYRTQLEGKPANMMENILKGKIQKFYGEICLIHQPFVKEPKQSITDLLEACSKATGDTVAIKRFARFQLGAA